MSKIFCIGDNKTGTTSLTSILRTLGYSVCPEDIMYNNDFQHFKNYKNGEYNELFELVEKWDAFEDRPWCHGEFYKILDEKHPNSKFILTTRNVEDWWQSYQRWDKLINLKKRNFYSTISQISYGVDSFLDHPDLAKTIYIDRNNEARRYFANRPSFLELPIENSDKLSVLCNFLGKTIPNVHYPHLNKTNMAEGIYKITEQFEKELCKYTGATYAVAVDNQSNALFLALMYENVKEMEISIPCRTYPSVPCEIIHAGARVKWLPVEGTTIKGAYQLAPTKVWDAALRFTHNMYIPNTHMCVSFTGPYKHLKLSKGGAILTDDEKAYNWFKKARFSGRNECSYHEDEFNMLGWNFYMMPEIATRGMLLMKQFYNMDGSPKHNEDVELPYPDLSRFPIYGKV